MATDVILHLDIALKHHELSLEKRDLRHRLKKRLVALDILERARKKQCSRITNLREGDANTRYFHLRANEQRRKLFYPSA